jgi:hypothetical protein
VPERTNTSAKPVNEHDTPKSLIHVQNLPSEIWAIDVAVITKVTILTAMKTTTRNISIFLDPWYMAYNRAIMMTCTMIQWNHIAEVSQQHSPPIIATTTTLIQCRVMVIILPNKSCSLVTPRGWSTSRRNSQLWQSLQWTYKLTNHLPLHESGIYWTLNSRHGWKKTHLICHRYCENFSCVLWSEWTNMRYATRGPTQYTQANCEGWLISATSNAQPFKYTYTAESIPM